MRTALDVLRGRVHVRDVTAPLRRSRGPSPRLEAAAPWLLLSPHMDDAVLSCWHALAGPQPLVVVNVFTGAPPPGVLTSYDRIAGTRSSAEMMAEREREDREALALAGRAPQNLGFPEDQYRRRAPAVDHLLAAFATHCPVAAGVIAPAAIGGHPDHVLARAAALAMLARGVPVRLYADLPYCVTYGWPAWVTGTPAVAHLAPEAYWAPALDPLGGALGEAEVRALDPGAQKAKLRALRRYATQYPTLSRGPLDVLAHPAVLGHELLWTLSGPRGGARTR